MISLISKHIVHFFINQNAISKEEEEVYIYGTEIITSIIISILMSLIITLLLSKWYYFVIFYTVFIPVRINAGGYHADTYGSCFATTMTFYCAYLVLANYYIMPIYAVLIIMAISVFVIFKFAPIIHPNNVITEEGIKSRKFYSRLFVTSESILVILLLVLEVNFKIINAIVLTWVVLTISIMINIINERRTSK